MHLHDLLARENPSLSFEFFPPKTPEDRDRLAGQIRLLGRLAPDFISITYGAGGGTRELTSQLVEELRDLRPVPHLTCVGHTREEIRGILTRHAAAGVSNILALRGDAPTHGAAAAGDFPYASDLVKFIREFARHRDPRGFGIGVAGFPEGHPATPNRMKEMDHLKAKVDAGADYICTQLFMDNHDFHDFRDRCDLAGIHIPIIAGILPLTSLGMMKRMADLAGGARFPAKLLQALKRAATDADAVRRVGIHHAATQCADLLDQQVAGLHFYTMNQAGTVMKICENIGLRVETAAA